ncbi:GvpL/GvpF family gas vesicle protein [Streptomyces sp. SAJ15]|uniref:GvpL/GvpF family gas vesicle protein n=1 Tax=Streptomyces sp. SAJ15 TaxID=2011095 RepID=UPI0011851A2E|nr:GvpL/GvpF family gas vesicle protein [Streptomyces sp. SAJ15]TVL89303.1 gas vesicle protein [Streptomyces sp. SAJ15]
MTDTVTYAYAVARNTEGLSGALSEVEGVVGAPVRLTRAPGDDELVAAVSPVPARDFSEEALKRHLEDLAWLEAVARAHHAVVEALAARTSVLPLRLATVYLDDVRVAEVLDAGRAAFLEQLSRLAAHVEWGVKVYVDPSADAAAAAEPEAAGGLSPGRAYLRGRSAQRRSREESFRAARQAAERVEEVGRRHAADRTRHRAQQGELAGGPGVNVVNDAYLVARDRAERFRTEVERAAEGLPGVRVELTGPWAPYSFAAPPAAEEPPSEELPGEELPEELPGEEAAP